jgi:hypothetical protein
VKLHGLPRSITSNKDTRILAFLEDTLEKYGFQMVVQFYISSSNIWIDRGGEPKYWKCVKEFEWGEAKSFNGILSWHWMDLIYLFC